MRMVLLGFMVGVATLAYGKFFSVLSWPVSIWWTAMAAMLVILTLRALKPVQSCVQQRPVYDFFLHMTVFACALLFGMGYSHYQLQQALQARLTQPVERTALVKVTTISDGVGENWRQVVEEIRPDAMPPQRWVLYSAFDWQAQQKVLPPDMQPGQVWQVKIRLKPVHGNASWGAFDVEKWLLQQHIQATGTVLSAQRLNPQQIRQFSIAAPSMLENILYGIQQERLRIRQHIMQFDSPAKGVLLGLLTGDRSLIDAKTTLLYQQMGISHLLAISGPHVLLAAFMMSWLLQKLLNGFPQLYLKAERRRWILPFFLFMVLLYAGLAGFDIPAQRTVVMVALLVVLLWFRQRWQSSSILLLAGCILLLLDPLAILSVAFWLSFGAVAILLSMHRSAIALEEAATPVSKIKQYKQASWQFVLLQWRLFVLLAPLVLLSFAKISWLAPVVNLLAIPLLSLVVLPLNLLAYAVGWFSPSLADVIWQLALMLLTFFHALLNTLAQLFPYALQPFSLTAFQLLALFLVLLFLLLPKGIFSKWWIAFLLIPVFYPLRAVAPLSVHVLDVGQGLSVLIQTKNHNMLLDAGGKLMNSDMGEKVVIPALQAQGVKRLDKLMLSHLDLDHSGGAPAILQQFPVIQLTSSEVYENYPTYLCEAGQSWQWDGVLFKVLSPLVQHRAFNDKNESSCVLMVETPAQKNTPAQRLLVMGDAGLYTEFLLQQQQADLKADILILGHHGSKYSSSSAFLKVVNPQRAVVSAGYLNRYGHPAPIVLARLNELGITVDSTIDSGTLSYQLGNDVDLEPVRFRDQKTWLRPPSEQ
ncbi:DNA internalization-related competence protein ComEC/Rec2 [Alkanindiges sp. WGS2144]|uniref:DNA internalization-related competence protein ComEC/Rec2 n=1 Tax=Alkanindiges sp. WGS2144 TaxID=3366808 RepID=UPI00374FF37C